MENYSNRCTLSLSSSVGSSSLSSSSFGPGFSSGFGFGSGHGTGHNNGSRAISSSSSSSSSRSANFASKSGAVVSRVRVCKASLEQLTSVIGESSHSQQYSQQPDCYYQQQFLCPEQQFNDPSVSPLSCSSASSSPTNSEHSSLTACEIEFCDMMGDDEYEFDPVWILDVCGPGASLLAAEVEC